VAAGLGRRWLKRFTEHDWLDARRTRLALYFVTTDHDFEPSEVPSEQPETAAVRVCVLSSHLVGHPNGWPRQAVSCRKPPRTGWPGFRTNGRRLCGAESLLGLGGWHVRRVPEAALAGGDDRAVWALGRG